MKVITQNDIQKINEAYLRLKTYAAVSRELGFSPGTVKKYIIKDYHTAETTVKQVFNRPLPDFDPNIFRLEDWGKLCELTGEEEHELKLLWKELEW